MTNWQQKVDDQKEYTFPTKEGNIYLKKGDKIAIDNPMASSHLQKGVLFEKVNNFQFYYKRKNGKVDWFHSSLTWDLIKV